MRVMAIDPGGTTGWVLIGVGKKTTIKSYQIIRAAKEVGGFMGGEIKGKPERQAKFLYELAKDRKVDVLVIEDFYIKLPVRTTNTNILLSPVRVAWALVGMFQFGDYNPIIVWQQPTQLGVVTDARLKAWGLWVPGKKDMRAAIKHLVVYLRGR